MEFKNYGFAIEPTRQTADIRFVGKSWFCIRYFQKCGIVQLLDFDFQLIAGPGVVLVFSNYAL